jgi:hypothetical protein
MIVKNVLIAPIYNAYDSYKGDLNNFKNSLNAFYKTYYFISLMCTPLTFLTWLISCSCYVIVSGIFLFFVFISYIFYKIILVYKNGGFYDVFTLFLIIIIRMFLTKYSCFDDTINLLLPYNNLQLDEFVYIFLKIDVDEFSEYILNASNKIIKLMKYL